MDNKIERKNKRKKAIRKKMSGTAERPRLCVFKSNRNLYVQIIDDSDGKTICGVSTQGAEIAAKMKASTRKNQKFGEELGAAIAKAALGKGVKKVAFDRGGNLYHGVVKALADSARKNGLEF